MKNELNSSSSAMKFAHPFRARNEMTPKGFSDELTEIREQVINKLITVSEAKVALLSLQIQLNHSALEIEYMKMDQDKRLVWRMPLLDRHSEQHRAIELDT